MKTLVAIGSCMGAPHYFNGLGLTVKIINNTIAADHLIDSNTVIMYGGGEDISPALYNAPKNPKTWAPESPSPRDALEAAVYKLGVERGAAHYGICRGHQLLAALAGGRLFQHVDNHHSSHISSLTEEAQKIINHKPRSIYVTSVHHQAVDIESLKAAQKDTISILENPPMSPRYHVDKQDVLDRSEVKVDNEAFLIPSLRIFGVQGHPEFDSMDSPFVKFCRDMMVHLVEETHAN